MKIDFNSQFCFNELKSSVNVRLCTFSFAFMYKYLGWLQKSWIWDVLSLRLYMFFVAKEEDSSRLTIPLVTKWASLDRTWEPIAELQEFVWNTLNASLWHLGYWRIIKIWDILVYSRDILIPNFPLKLFLLLLLFFFFFFSNTGKSILFQLRWNCLAHFASV